MKKRILPFVICSLFLVACNPIQSTPNNDQSNDIAQAEVPSTYQNFVDCRLNTFDVAGERIEVEGDIKLAKKEAGTRYEWKYYELLREGKGPLPLSGKSGSGVPDYNYGNLNVASMVNGHIKGAGIKKSYSPFHTEEMTDGVVLTEIEGYLPLCCYAGVSDEEVSYFKAEIETLKKSITSAENVRSLEGKAACANSPDLFACSRRLIEGYRADIAKFEKLVADKHYAEESCLWAKNGG